MNTIAGFMVLEEGTRKSIRKLVRHAFDMKDAPVAIFQVVSSLRPSCAHMNQQDANQSGETSQSSHMTSFVTTCP